ncbi:MAG TPA: low molecular weight protein-tyrosine-phosphatase [Burkholderiales bacterium]|nr:low molecular weight protein-tyrosine-phosphatase [Burkholderiales bacterium]
MPATSDRPMRVLFVCTGNICRSPTAEGIFLKLVRDAGLEAKVLADSAGTHGYHVGEPPDLRTCEAATRRGYDLTGLRARKFERADFHRFDLVLAMDRENHSHLARLVPPTEGHKLKMMMEYARRFREPEVPDPYYGGSRGFELVLDMLEDASRGLLETLVEKQRAPGA